MIHLKLSTTQKQTAAKRNRRLVMSWLFLTANKDSNTSTSVLKQDKVLVTKELQKGLKAELLPDTTSVDHANHCRLLNM
jgi:hypothetical protein